MKGRWVRKNIWYVPDFREIDVYSKVIYLKCIAFCKSDRTLKLLNIVEPNPNFKNAINELIKYNFLKFCSKRERKIKVLKRDELWKYHNFPKDRYGNLRKKVYRRDKFTCQYCGSRKDLSLDHLIPQSKGGKDTIQNLVTACQSCNSKKGARTPRQANMELINDPRVGDKNGKTR